MVRREANGSSTPSSKTRSGQLVNRNKLLPEGARDSGGRMQSMKKRSANREPTSYARTRRTTKRPKRNKSLVDEEVGDFIVVDTGIVGDTGTIRNTGDTGTVEDENPKPTSASIGSDATRATLQGDGTAVQTKHRKPDTDPDATQKAKDALFVLDSIPDLVEKKRDRLPNSISSYCPSPDEESRQSRITRPFRSHTQDSNLPNVPQAFLQSPGQTSIQNIGAREPWTGSLTSHHDQPAQQLSKLRSDNTSKASQSQVIAPLDLNKPRQSSTGITSTNNSIYQATGLMRQPLPEQNPDTSLPVSNFPGPALSLSPTPSNFAGTRASHVRHLHALPASNLENTRMTANHQLPATAVTRRHYGPPSPYPPPFRPDNDDTTTPQTRSIPAQVNRVSHQPLQSIKDPSQSHHNSMWMNVITDASRTANDKKRLRDRATELIARREDVELEEDETTGGRRRVYPDACGAVVDKYSAKGIVAITAHGFPVQQVDTGQGVIGDPYAELIIGVGQTCLIHGSSTVLYYKPRKVSVSDQALRPSQPRAAPQPRECTYELEKPPPSPAEITIRLQVDEVGKFSAPYDFSVWRPKIKTTEFFAWFGGQTGRGGANGPQLLAFTLKDAMPDRITLNIPILNQGDFRWMRKCIMTQFDKAKSFMPGLKNFAVLVTDPEWVSPPRRRIPTVAAKRNL
ncbi:uncharacterized protein PAC_14799 [Phialocephala subalpina]|uniref:Uncharacterized protein n=1 Tax=Phialocephala subalpina TaxID=576137 RepID=A0A1L7XIM9_9HELO|nr:uncharacterized protein PAC_14799 [Phialocephala subalpina]